MIELTQTMQLVFGLIVIVLVFIGAWIKAKTKIDNRAIPFILFGIGMLLSVIVLGFHWQNLIVGVVAAFAAVFSHQSYKQLSAKEAAKKLLEITAHNQSGLIGATANVIIDSVKCNGNSTAEDILEKVSDRKPEEDEITGDIDTDAENQGGDENGNS